MSLEIRSQKIARAAFRCVERHVHRAPEKYLAFARTFPTLIHTSGLAQAGAFALAKGEEKLEVLNDLADVMNAADEDWQFVDGAALDEKARRRETDVWTYLRMTRQALQAATWIKRYAEALLASKKVACTDSANPSPESDSQAEGS
jgi:CRISPR-associated protein Cmr5